MITFIVDDFEEIFHVIRSRG